MAMALAALAMLCSLLYHFLGPAMRVYCRVYFWFFMSVVGTDIFAEDQLAERDSPVCHPHAHRLQSMGQNP
ncbi:MAG: hypothetical protein C0610_04740 [Desulfobacteraceae bacterium]|nr:MAG: hypothetical protein C0610_04740 [Desulfobacteraceae bacterium]